MIGTNLDASTLRRLRPEPPPPAGAIRVLTLNLWGEQGPFAERWPALVAGVVAWAPDVVLLQESRRLGETFDQAMEIADKLSGCHAFAIATEWGGGVEGLAIVTRHASVQGSFVQQELPHATADERRVVLGLTIDHPAGPVGVFTTHLNYRLGDGQKREDQIVAAEKLVATHTARVKIWGGDFNATPDSDEIRWLKGQRSIEGRRTYYQDAYALRHPGERGATWSSKNPHTDPLAWLEPDRRIDYLFVSHMNRDGSGAVLRAELALDRADEHGMFPSDHFAVVADIQIAPTRTI